jgi:large subunit ribosomal protein L3
MAVTGILGKKVGMTQLFDDKGDVHPVTVLKAGPCVITQLKTAARDGYDAAQIGSWSSSRHRRQQAHDGHFAKSSVPPRRMMKEVRSRPRKARTRSVKAGDRVMVDIFTDAKFVDVIGTSKGRGFAGVVRRHHFGGGPKAHGHMFQVQGSIGHLPIRRAFFPASACPATWATSR